MRAVLVVLFAFGCAHVPSERFVRGPQGRLRVDDGGRAGAVPFLFVHGNGANHTQWRAQLEHLRPARRAIAFDLRGMGESDPPANGDFSLDAMTEDIEAVALALRVPRFVLVGHSYGGAVVAAYAAKHPERVAGLVFAEVAGNVRISDDQAQKFLAALRADKDGVVSQWFGPILRNASEEVKAAVLGSVRRTPVEVLIAGLEVLRAFDMTNTLSAYPGPRLAIAAAPLEQPMSLHRQFTDMPVRKMEGVSHWLMMDRPDEFNRYLDEFISTIH